MSGKTALAELDIGFIPLIDASILIAAHERGFAENRGLRLKLHRETSWANIRDRLAIGHFDAAHMLAPMPIAANLGLTAFSSEMVVPMALGLGGNAVTLATRHFDLLKGGPFGDAGSAGRALKALIEWRADAGNPKLRLGVVHPHSAHNLELRYWLAGCGIAPDHDVEIVILPPTLMSDALEAGTIDGYCVGEPWNSVALANETGRIVTSKELIWASSPEKVLGVPIKTATEQQETIDALLKALVEAACWCANPAHRDALAAMLAAPNYLALPAPIIEKALSGAAAYEPFAKAATFPWQSHALWFYTQLVRWGMVEHTQEAARTAAQTYRPDLYRAALGSLDIAMPTANAKVEGALRSPQFVGATGGKLQLGPDGFFDGVSFDPDRIDAYVAAQKTR